MRDNGPMRADTACPVHTTCTNYGICLGVTNKHGRDENRDRKSGDFKRAHRDLQSLEAPTRSNAHAVGITDWGTGEAPRPTANNNRSYDQAVSLIGCVLLTQEIPNVGTQSKLQSQLRGFLAKSKVRQVVRS